MRIRGSGKDTGGFGGGWSRSDSFRHKHRLGQKVRGLLLSHVEDDMAWVEIDGDRLLAQLETAHPEGARLTFVVEQLTPHIILKELKEFAQGQGGVSAISLATAFDAARALFEARFHPLARTLNVSRSAFFTLLAGSAELFARYADAARCAKDLTGNLGENGGRFLYQPWLAPESRRQVTFIRPSPNTGLTEVVVEFEHPDLGLARAEFLHKEDRVGCRMKVQHMDRAEDLARYLSTRTYRDLPFSIDPPLVSKLPRSSHGGIIAERIFRS